MENLHNLLLSIGLGLYGCYGIFLGLANKKFGKEYLDIFILLSLFFVRIFFGEEAANRRKENLKNRTNAKLVSTNYLLVGFTSLGISIIILLDQFL